jgi:tetratricopeptide (TPR) repeat protein
VLTQVLSGLGGVGKTQLAAHYARRAWQTRSVDLLIWVTATSREAVVATYAQAAAEIDPAAARLPEADRRAAWLLTWLQNTERPWLIILDDLADPAHLNALWPPGSNPAGRTLVTTRRRDAALATTRRGLIDVGLFTPDEAHHYLADKLADLTSHEPATLDEANELAADLGHLPLALAQAAAYIIDRNLNCASYRQRYADQRRHLPQVLPDVLPDDHHATVAAIWALSIDAANQLAPAGLARPALQLASMLDSNGIPAAVFTTTAALAYLADTRGEGSVDADDARDAISCLHRLSLLTYNPTDTSRSVRVHSLVQRATREQLTHDQTAAAARAAADALLQTWPDIPEDPALSQALRDNAAAIHHYAEPLLWQRDAHSVLLRVGDSLGEAGQTTTALEHYQRLHVLSTQHLGPDHRDTLIIRNNLARFRGDAGDMAGAAAAYQGLLDDQMRLLGPEHPDTLTTRNNLAYCRREAGDPAGAAAALAELLKDVVRLLGPDHHPIALTIRNNLARHQGEDGNPAAAATTLSEVLDDRIRVLGPDHPDTLTTRGDLARFRGKAGDMVRAAAAYQQLLDDRIRVLGPDHPETLGTRANIACFRGEAGDPARAVAALAEVIHDMERVLGPDHPDTLTTRNNLARFRWEAGDPTDAVAAFAELLNDRIRVLGPDHPDTLTTRAYLARFCGEAGDPASAAAAYQDLLKDQQRVLGTDHPDTLAIRANIAYWCGKAGDPASAVETLQELLPDVVRLLGPNHPHTLDTRTSLANWRKIDLIRRALEMTPEETRHTHGGSADIAGRHPVSDYAAPRRTRQSTPKRRSGKKKRKRR